MEHDTNFAKISLARLSRKQSILHDAGEGGGVGGGHKVPAPFSKMRIIVTDTTTATTFRDCS